MMTRRDRPLMVIAERDGKRYGVYQGIFGWYGGELDERGRPVYLESGKAAGQWCVSAWAAEEHAHLCAYLPEERW